MQFKGYVRFSFFLWYPFDCVVFFSSFCLFLLWIYGQRDKLTPPSLSSVYKPYPATQERFLDGGQNGPIGATSGRDSNLNLQKGEPSGSNTRRRNRSGKKKEYRLLQHHQPHEMRWYAIPALVLLFGDVGLTEEVQHGESHAGEIRSFVLNGTLHSLGSLREPNPA